MRIVPANEAEFDDLATVLGQRGPASRCWCQRYKLHPGESFAGFAAGEAAERLSEQTRCGDPNADSTSGLVAYLGDEPVGWCAVEPRAAYHGMQRKAFRIPWEGRDEDRDDESVWVATCLFARAGYRKRGVARALAVAAVEHAGKRGARAVEAYPILVKDVIEEELHVGTESVFADAGFVMVSHPTKRRAVMRLDY